jgi:hypothetical protein
LPLYKDKLNTILRFYNYSGGHLRVNRKTEQKSVKNEQKSVKNEQKMGKTEQKKIYKKRAKSQVFFPKNFFCFLFIKINQKKMSKNRLFW